VGPPAQKEVPAPTPNPRIKKPPTRVPEPPVVAESPAQDKVTLLPPRHLPPGPERRLSLVIDDVGYRPDLAQDAADKLPKETTFAVIPFLPHSEESARLLKERGFAVILHCPMEPERSGQWKSTPGTLMVGMPPDEVERILDSDLRAVPGAEGVNNHMGSLATTHRPLMDAVMTSLDARGLYFLDSRTSARTVAYEAARAVGVKAAFRSVFLDDVDEDGAIIKQIDLWVARSEREGAPVAIGHLRPRTIDALAFRLPYWRSKGVRLSPLREVVH
jgi:polysaccharide deacetylase 2 family uncharacterized protein YibQ